MNSEQKRHLGAIRTIGALLADIAFWDAREAKRGRERREEDFTEATETLLDIVVNYPRRRL